MTTKIAKISKYVGENPNDFVEHDDLLKQYISAVDRDLTSLFLAIQRLQNIGSDFIGRTAVTDTAYTVLSTDFLVAYTTLTSGRAVTLPDPATVTGKTYIIKDEAGTAGANTLTIAGASGNIDGAATKTITSNYGVVRVYAGLTNYFTW